MFKNILPRTLFGRSLLILAVPVVLIQLVTTYVFFNNHWSRITGRLAYAVAGEIALIADEIEQAGTGAVTRVSSSASRHLNLLVSYEQESILGDDIKSRSSQSVVARRLYAAMEEQVRRPSIVTVRTREKWVDTSVQLEGGVLRVSLPQRRLFSASSYIFLLWMTAASLLLLAVAVVFMRNQIRPIRRLAVVAERFGRGLDAPSSFKPEGAYEVRQASRAFLDMHDRIRRQIQQRTAMLAGISHDLRTPLTRMKLQLAMMPANPDIDALKGDVADMERMINSYLDFVRDEGGEQPVYTDIRDLLERVAAGARRQGAVVDLSPAGDLSALVRPVAFERCLSNLVGNARQYASAMWIEARKEDGHLLIVIDDNGPGIPEDKMGDMFRPFVRGEPSRNPVTGGVGLGLPIAQDIVHSHGGQITLAKSPRGGLRVRLTIPA